MSKRSYQGQRRYKFAYQYLQVIGVVYRSNSQAVSSTTGIFKETDPMPTGLFALF